MFPEKQGVGWRGGLMDPDALGCSALSRAGSGGGGEGKWHTHMLRVGERAWSAVFSPSQRVTMTPGSSHQLQQEMLIELIITNSNIPGAIS